MRKPERPPNKRSGVEMNGEGEGSPKSEMEATSPVQEKRKRGRPSKAELEKRALLRKT